ncbi:MAG: TonB-dependent receptor plug domain-containing protein, partial [Halomonas sp.]|nr:TonB-dependent receptor plug domain-containing protein [Halomonas sp.]
MPRFTRSVLASAVALAVSAGTATAQEAQQLDNIVVSASGFEQAMVDAPASISVVSREELERKRVTSTADALRDVEGVDVGGSVGKTGGRNISMRGMPSDYTLILIDGRRQNTAGSVTPNGFGETSTSFFPPVSSIERIEVIRGPMSTLYGSDAMGGVINIITRRVDREWVGSVGVESTFNEDRDFGDRREINLYASGPLIEDTLGVQLRGRVYER